jgi:hypothetical protein
MWLDGDVESCVEVGGDIVHPGGGCRAFPIILATNQSKMPVARPNHDQSQSLNPMLIV